MNPIIEVNGDQAVGHWLLFQPCTDSTLGGAAWLAATYSDVYVRSSEGWLIDQLKIDVAFFTPYEAGWVEKRFLDGREP